MENNGKSVLNVSLAIMVCLRIAEDICTELFNKPFVKAKDRKADILLTYECFEKIRKGLRKGLGKEEAEKMQEKICEYADTLEQYVKSLRNEFYTNVVRKFKYEQSDCVALGMTLNAVIHVADEMFVRVYGHKAKKIDEILFNLDNFGKKYTVQTLNKNDNGDIDASHAEPHVQLFVNNLIELCKEKEE